MFGEDGREGIMKKQKEYSIHMARRAEQEIMQNWKTNDRPLVIISRPYIAK